MRRKLLSLALALALTLTLIPTAYAAGQFTDVPDTSPFAPAIAWAVERNVTKGTSDTTFSPGNPCTVSHILTFLWRGNGRPNESGTERESVIAWANGLGIDTSDLGAVCTRSMAVYYMWLAAGKPEGAAPASFGDVPASASYAKAVNWAVDRGVTTGTGGNTFSPDSPCTRGQVVTFLYRSMGNAAPAAPAAPAQGTTESKLESGIWVNDIQPNDSEIIHIRELYKFSGSNYSFVRDVLTGEEYDSIQLYEYQEGTYRVSDGKLVFTQTKDSSVSGVDAPEVDSETKTYEFEFTLEGKTLKMEGFSYTLADDQAAVSKEFDELKARASGTLEISLADALKSGYWGGVYTIDGEKYTDMFWFDGSNYNAISMFDLPSGSQAILYEVGTYQLGAGDIFFTPTNKVVSIGGVSQRDPDHEPYVWSISWEDYELKLNTHDFKMRPALESVFEEVSTAVLGGL